MFQKPEIVRNFILDVEHCIRYSKSLSSCQVILKNAAVVSSMSEDTDFMLIEGVLTVVFSLHHDISKEAHPTPDELRELTSSICDKLQVMAGAVAAQNEREVWSSLISLPLGPIMLKHKMLYENRTKAEEMSVDFEIEKVKKKIYDEFLKDDSDVYKKSAELLGGKIKR